VRKNTAGAGPSLMRAVASQEGDRVTTLELFFDLAFVFAFTQLSRLMAQQHDGLGVLQALVILALLWWTWTAYGWLSNLAHADEGVVRIVMIVGMIAAFVVGVVVLEAYEDLPGGLFAPLILVSAYLIARIAHALAFIWLSDPQLRRRTAITVGLSVAPSGALLAAGTLFGASQQVWFWLAAVAVEPLVAYRSSIGVDWSVHSTIHFTERHGLILILALGESILAIGVGVAAEPVSSAILVGIVLSMSISLTMWWAYFSRLARSAEQALQRHHGGDRARVATDGYTYLHLFLVAGIVLAALGVEVAMAHISDSEQFGLFGACALGGGVACYLAGTGFFARRVVGERSFLRLTAATVLALVVPFLAVLTPMAALATVAAALIVLLMLEGRALVPAGVPMDASAGS
jgi:low temperature requirement protein LtrA